MTSLPRLLGLLLTWILVLGILLILFLLPPTREEGGQERDSRPRRTGPPVPR